VAVIAVSTSRTMSEHAKNVSMDMAGTGFSPRYALGAIPSMPPIKLWESASETCAVKTSMAEYLKPAANVPSLTLPTKKLESQHCNSIPSEKRFISPAKQKWHRRSLDKMVCVEQKLHIKMQNS